MKVKTFSAYDEHRELAENRTDVLQRMIQQFLDANPNIEVIGFAQSENPTVSIQATLIYREK